MRLILILILLAVICAGCHGSALTTHSPVSDSPAFAGLPSPAALLELDTGRDVSTGKQASLLAMYMGHEYTDTLPHSDNISTDLLEMSTGMGGRKTPLTYCLYRIEDAVVPGGMQFNDIQVDYRFTTADPTPPDGLYVGISDFVTGRWVWIELRPGADPVDLTGLMIYGNVGPEYLAFVNFSDVPLVISSIDFTFGPDTTTGDWLYYTQYPVFTPAEPTGIARVPIDGSLPPETIHTGIMDTGYFYPQVRHLPTGDELYYNRVVLGDYEVWMSSMDGSGAAVHHDGTQNMHIMDWSADGSVELYASGDSSRTGWWYNWTSAAGGSITPLNGNIIEMVFDPYSGAFTYEGFLVLEQPVPTVTQGLFHFGTDTLPWSDNASTVAYDGTEVIRSIVCTSVRGGTGTNLEGVWFVSDTRNPDNPLDTTDNILVQPLFTPATVDYLVDENYDFSGVTFSPDGSHVAFMVRDPGDAAWDVYVTLSTRQHEWPDLAPIVVDDCWGDLEWYHPSP